MIILPETNFPDSYAVAERIKQSIANLSIPIPNSHKIVNITISLGLVVYDSEHYRYNNFEEMVQEADMALYESKNNGRNQISHYCQ